MEARLVVGLPMLTSPANLAFWATLCNCWGVDGLDAVMADFKAAEAAGKPQLRQFCRAWNADLLQKVCVWLLVTNGSGGGGGWSMPAFLHNRFTAQHWLEWHFRGLDHDISRSRCLCLCCFVCC